MMVRSVHELTCLTYFVPVSKLFSKVHRKGVQPILFAVEVNNTSVNNLIDKIIDETSSKCV